MKKETTYGGEKNGRKGTSPRHDPRIVELVKLLARISAKRDYNRLVQQKFESLSEEPPQ